MNAIKRFATLPYAELQNFPGMILDATLWHSIQNYYLEFHAMVHSIYTNIYMPRCGPITSIRTFSLDEYAFTPVY